jgi:hypothetical protein
MSDVTAQTVLFPDLFPKPVHVSFSREHISSNGGTVLLRAKDQELGLCEALAGCIQDTRQQSKVEHGLVHQFQQRVASIALGYPDGNDAAKLRDDPMMKMACGLDPVRGPSLASQPTLSRFENAPDARSLLQMSYELAHKVIERQARRRRGKRISRIIIDVDPTCDPTYGDQQLTLFNGFYHTHCYLPLVVTISFGKERRRYPVAAVLRKGTAAAMEGTLGVVRRLIQMLRDTFGSVALYLRADSAFAVPAFFDLLEAQQVRYAIAIKSNAVLERLSEPLMRHARRQADEKNKTATLYGEDSYKSGRWRRARWAAYKAQVVVHPDKEHPRDNDRYLIHNLDCRFTPEGVFALYYRHSDMENSIKELKNDLAMDRTSCPDFLPNQLRLIMTMTAYVLLQAVTEDTEHEDLLRAQMATLRDRLLKIAVRVRSTARRIVLEFTSHHPWVDAWIDCAKTVGAVPI